MSAFIAAVIILAASFVFAMLGLGGGMVYVPVLKWLGYSFKETAIPLGLLLNGLNTLLALIPFSRAGLVHWRGGAVLTVSALLLAPLGARASGLVPAGALSALFAVGVFAAAARMLLTASKPEPTALMAPGRRAALGVAVGGFAGFAGGLLGIGGGFIIAPALMWMGYGARQAAATTALAVTFSSFSGYLAHAAGGAFDLRLTLPAVAAVLVGSQLGASFAARAAKPALIKKVYAVTLLFIGAKMAADVLL